MKIFYTHLTKVLLFVFLAITFSGNSQEKFYETQLETIYLNTTKEIVFENSFSTYNEDLIGSDNINFKKAIKFSKKKNSPLYFHSNKHNVKLAEASYLKMIRKAANRSTNTKAFQIYLKDIFPQLSHQFSLDNNLEELYLMSRKNTFNGKIDALPSVL